MYIARDRDAGLAVQVWKGVYYSSKGNILWNVQRMFPLLEGLAVQSILQERECCLLVLNLVSSTLLDAGLAVQSILQRQICWRSLPCRRPLSPLSILREREWGGGREGGREREREEGYRVTYFTTPNCSVLTALSQTYMCIRIYLFVCVCNTNLRLYGWESNVFVCV